MLKKDKKRMDKERAEISIEELIEKERTQLDSSKLTKVTLLTFVAWKKKKLAEKLDAEKKEMRKKDKAAKAGNIGGMSGRDMFLLDPSMLARHTEEDDGEDFDLTREPGEDDGAKVAEIFVRFMVSNFARFTRSSLTSTGSCRMVLTSRRTSSLRGLGGRSRRWMVLEPGQWMSTRIFLTTRIWMSWKMIWTAWKCKVKILKRLECCCDS